MCVIANFALATSNNSPPPPVYYTGLFSSPPMLREKITFALHMSGFNISTFGAKEKLQYISDIKKVLLE